jgi:hypothetical protein
MENFKEFLEIIYFISGPILVIIAYLALGQIKVAKEQIEEQKNASKINSKRDALKLTSEQITHSGAFIIPLQNALNVSINKNNIKYFDESSVEILGNKIKVTPCKREGEFEKLSYVGSEFTAVMNAMEGFAVFFSSGVADEKIAFYSLSETYCNQIKLLLPLLVPIRAGEKKLTACMHLFTIWNSRLEAEKLEMQKSELDKKIKNHKTHTVTTVGTA